MNRILIIAFRIRQCFHAVASTDKENLCDKEPKNDKTLFLIRFSLENQLLIANRGERKSKV